MTAADRIARLRGTIANEGWASEADVLALCDDYETLAADHAIVHRNYQALAANAEVWADTHNALLVRCTLTDEETEAARRCAAWLEGGPNKGDWATCASVLRRLIGETT